MEEVKNVVKEEPISEVPKNVEIPKYDPEKKYEWKQEDLFVFSGAEFGMMLNALRTILGTAEAQRILLAERANMIVENVLARAVKEGRVKPKEE
jgi:hypothetical protein